MVFVVLIEDNATYINEKECERGFCKEKKTFSSPMVFAGSENARKDVLKNAAD